MEYRTLPHGGERFSVMGLGLGSISEITDATMEEVFEYAAAHGINYFDLVGGTLDVFRAFGRVFRTQRDKVHTQMHFGGIYDNDEKYGMSRDLPAIQRTFDRLLEETGLGYTDMGYFHCVGREADFEQIMQGGLFDYVCRMKEQGLVHHIGFSSHSPVVANRFLDTGVIDMCMFSINPAYDYSKGAYGYGQVDERQRFYQRCQQMGVGIAVMKPFCAGQLLDAQRSPLGVALTREQCLQYALDRPGVLVCLPGVRGLQDVKDALTFFDAPPEARDYSILGSVTPEDAYGRCVYCNHCQPCPMGIDVGLVNKYYDLARMGDELARRHYEKLTRKADACVGCGHCERQCPFQVKQVSRMAEINEYFSNIK